MKSVRNFGDQCRLESVTSPLKGEVFPLARDRISIGSDPSNDLTICDASIAKRHCLLIRDKETVVVVDLESPQGTFVNGIVINERILEDGDTLRIGDCELVYRDGNEIARQNTNLNAERHDVIEVLPAPLLHQPSLPPPQVTDVGRMARDLNALFKVINAINSHRDLESLQKGILQLLFEVVPADAGAIQIIDNVDRTATSTVSWKREGHLVPDLTVRHEIVLKTFWERSAVVADLCATSRQTEKVLCVPLVALQKTIGVIYLVCFSPSESFGRDHINFVTSVAAIAAVTLESVLAMESLRAENRQLRRNWRLIRA